MQTDLDVFFAPRGVAVIGASRDEHKLGYGVMRNLVEHGYDGPVYPVNPKADEVLGRRCYAGIGDVPDPVDLAVIILSAQLVPEVMKACGRREVRGAIVVSGGFGETDAEGVAREDRLVEIAQRYGMRLMGPNCIGVLDPITGLNTTFVAGMPEPGNIAFVSQSGAIGGAILDWAQTEGVGFSRFVSLGNQADVTETEVLAFLENDQQTDVIAMYLEGIADGRTFMQVARRVSRQKPIVVLKVGTTDAGARAAASHTGALAGAAHVYRAALCQCGILQAESVDDLFDWARVFSAHAELAGDAVAVVTNAGGPSVVAADGVARAGLQLAGFEPATVEQLKPALARYASVENPVDMLGGAGGSTYRLVTEAMLADGNVDGVVALHVPQALVSSEDVAEGIVEAVSGQSGATPVVACFMGGARVQSARDVLRTGGIPDYPSPERATRAMGALARRRRWLGQLDCHEDVVLDVDAERVRRWVEEAQARGREILAGSRAFDVAGTYGIPVAQTCLSHTPEEAVELAELVGYPVALKAVGPGFTHKTEVDGVVLGLREGPAVADAFRRLQNRASEQPRLTLTGALVQEMAPAGWEVIVGFTHDPQFGPVVMYGLGGIYVEVLEDVSFRVAPLTDADARAMIGETRSARLLEGVRGRPAANVEVIVDCLLRVSQLALDCPEIWELDINPLIVSEESALAVDVRISL